MLEYQRQLLENCCRNHYVGTILGRKREITGVRPTSTYQQRNQAEREAINMEIQGSAADLIKMAMFTSSAGWNGSACDAMLLQIHDELVFEAPPAELSAAAALVARK